MKLGTWYGLHSLLHNGTISAPVLSTKTLAAMRSAQKAYLRREYSHIDKHTKAALKAGIQPKLVRERVESEKQILQELLVVKHTAEILFRGVYT